MKRFRVRWPARIVLAILLVHLFGSAARAVEVPFGPPFDVSLTPDHAETVIVADMDGDGDLDAISGAWGSSGGTDDQVAWHENTAGDGSTWTTHVVSQSAYATSRGLLAADLDGDGDSDLVFPEFGDGLVWYENTSGDGSSFARHDVFENSEYHLSEALVASDVDRDGDLDVVEANEYDDVLYLHENTLGDGSTWTTHVVGGGVNLLSMTVADVDGDGDADVVSGAVDPTVAWYENTAGDGSVWTEHVISALLGHSDSVSAADVDGDGDVDVLSANAETFMYYENAVGNGSSWTERSMSTKDGSSTGSVYAVDVDGDGDVDALFTDSYLDKVGWNENLTGDGSAWNEHTISTTAQSPRSAIAADIDGDGDPDALCAQWVDNRIRWFENRAPHRGTAFTEEVAISTSAAGVRSVFSADVDGDGDLDALSASQLDDKIAWYENTAGDGSVWLPYEISFTSHGAWSVSSADMDGDGDADVLSASHDDDTIAWYENTAGDGSAWTPYEISTAADGATSVFAADVDRDGDADVLGALNSGNKVVWYENAAGDGSAWTSHDISTTADNGARTVVAADVDGDGDTDALAAIFGDHEVLWYENTAGDGSAWTTHVIATGATYVISVFAADVDGDGDTDALSAIASLDTIAWYENTAGDGSVWSTHTISTAADGAESVFATDLDGDGDTDVLSASPQDDKVAWYENTAGDGSLWTTHVVSNTADFATSVLAADVDGDGDTDVLSGSYGDDKVAWYENRGAHFFVGEDAWATAVGDTLEFDTTAVNVGLADELTGPPVANEQMGPELTFDGANTGLCRTFTLVSLEGGLTYDDNEGSAEWDEAISIGDIRDLWDDDFTLTFSPPVRAFGFFLLDNDDVANESYTVRAAMETPLGTLRWTDLPASGGDQTTFVGVITEDPIVKVEFDEDSEPDEIGILDFRFASDPAADSDDDGLSDCQEFSVGADPLDPDTDGDGVNDGPDTDPLDPTACGIDQDADGCDDCSSGTLDPIGDDGDSDGSCADSDCDDANDTVYPGAPQACDGVNNDCDHPLWPEVDGVYWTEPLGPFHSFNYGSDATSVVAADVDGDGYMDVLSAWEIAGYIGWFENTAGDGSAWTRHDIEYLGNQPVSLFAADIDGDENLDVLSASVYQDTLAWYENTAGNGLEWTPHTIPSTAGRADTVFAADVDGDADLDVLSAFFDDDKIAWYENTVGDGSTWTEHWISTAADGARSVFAADVDGDGHLDVLAAIHDEDKIAWYENTVGDGSAWNEHVISTAAVHAWSVHAADVDGDGNLDVLSSSLSYSGGYSIAWHENAAGNGSVWVSHAISSSSSDATSVVAADVDGDGDLDALAGTHSEIAWHENTDGIGTFGPRQRIALELRPQSVFAADLNGDGNPDALSAGEGYGTRWFRNWNGTNESDDDSDTFGRCADCDDANADIYPGAPEINDGLDNQCDGDDGCGLVDEISGTCGFRNPVDRDEFSWPAQAGAAIYQVERAATPDFSAGCTTEVVFDPYWLDTDTPGPSTCFHYLVRALAPYTGSWGADSSGVERTDICP